MFVTSTNTVGVSQRVVATLVACAVTLVTVGVFNTAQAANLSNVSNTLSTSEPNVTAAHTIAFTIPAGSALTGADDITITWDSQDDGAGGQDFSGINTVLVGDLTVTVAGGGDTATGFSATANSITFQGIDATAGQEVVVVVADGKITNPTTLGSYEIEIDTTTAGDLGRTRVAIVDTVLVTAIVETTFDFTISGLATSSAVNGETTTGSTTATQIPFGTLAADTAEVLGQRLNVTTNAANGFVVTVEQSQDLQSAGGGVIDSFTDGSYVDTPAVWAVPGDNISDETTWGHWGLTSDDADLNGDEFGSQLFVAASTTPREIFSHDGPSDGVTANVGSTTVAYKIEITPLQEAGDDYNTTLTYIATPTF